VRLISYLSPTGPRFGALDAGRVRDAGPNLTEPVIGADVGDLEELHLLPPVGRPGKIVCVGLNYRDHAAEAGLPVPEEPMIFAKLQTALLRPGAPIEIPPITRSVDFEAELGVIIGRTGRRIPASDALDHVFGYTCVNDVSARDLQERDGQFVRAKSLDTFCPTGPVVVTRDEIDDPGELGIRCSVNGQVMQDSTTQEMVHPVSELIAFISAAITLEAGDVIATGTPAGIGAARTPPRFLQPGDVVAVEIDGIGVLSSGVTSSPVPG
jgi:2-keto-4-pentenoate hydratase/2-oxohepta-3-ene-1,7-dioic acid hydratase in catechol pathway